MAMTTTQVQQILDQQSDPPDVGPPGSTGGDTGGYDPSQPPTSTANAAWLRDHGFDPNTFGKNPTGTLPSGWVINPSTGRLIPPGTAPTAGAGIGLGELFRVGDTVYRFNGRGITKATVAETKSFQGQTIDPSAPNGGASAAAYGGLGGDFADATANASPGELAALAQLAQGGSGVGASGSGSGGGRATVSPNKQAVKIGNDYYTFDPATGQYQLGIQGQPDPQQEFQNQLATRTANANDRGQDASILHNRAASGLSLGDLVRNLANDSYARAADPGNFPAYLAATAGLPQGAGSPVAQLLGKGVQIQSPEGSNPLADPRFQKLLDSEYTYGTTPDPAGVGQVRSIANANGGTLPQSFYDWTHTVNPVPAHAQGGTQMLNAPTVGIPANQLQPGQQPQFLAGEAGQEKITFQPVHSHVSQGTSVPHQHAQGDVTHEHAFPGAQASFKHYAEGGTAVTPAQGTDIALGKALPSSGWGEQGLQDQLNSGNGPTPGSVDEATWDNIAPSLKLLMQSGIKAQLGRSGLMDWLAELQKYQLPGLNNGGYTSVMNQ